MDPQLQTFLSRLEQLSDQFRELRLGFRQAIKIADDDPEMALTRARKVLEYVVRDVFERRINEPPGTRPLENLLQRLAKDGFFPDRITAFANNIRTLGNVGTHTFGEQVGVRDVYLSLAQLMPILEWYFENERPEALGGGPTKPHSAEPPARPRPEPAAAGPLAVVPKGLRSFDAHDADFFLDLLPGPRDRDGLPESIRFWKHRIEARDEPAFTLGVIYGPSGCGKSSLVKAGLLPRLSSDVLCVCIEATATETEARLLAALRNRVPGLPADADLVGAITALRKGTAAVREPKILIVIDQFEQWLHARRGEQDTLLAQALRQCDGQRVQCLVLVRDDFWLALSRFLAELNIDLVQGQNSALVDLFDPLHARRVLEAFGRAFGRLSAEPSHEQRSFVDQAVRGLTQDGRVISVRLALFADMVKGRPWTPATLKAVGGAEGVGVAFLEETFSAAAPPEHRHHEKAAQAVLRSLLPESGADIKGQMRSHAELLAASGCAEEPREFDGLLRILDGETRLITPTVPAGREKTDDSGSPPRPSGQYYQLTHDFLVQPLRQWLTQKQRETRRGRAELLLADRAIQWDDKPENRFLPSLGECLRIRLLTKNRQWSAPQQQMMARARRVHAVRCGIAAATILVVALVGLRIRGAVVERQNAARAEDLVGSLARADIAQVPTIVGDLTAYRTWADPLLRSGLGQAKPGAPERLALALALLPVDGSQVGYIRDQLLVATPQQFPIIRDALLNRARGVADLGPNAAATPDWWKSDVLRPLWQVALDVNRDARPRFQAAAALATYDPESKNWQAVQAAVADDLVDVPAVYLADWENALRGVREKLIPRLSTIYGDAARPELERSLATDILADYAAGDPAALAELVMSADPDPRRRQFAVIFPKLKAQSVAAVPILRATVARPLSPDPTDPANELLAKRQANAAVAQVRLGQSDAAWPLLKHPAHPEPAAFGFSDPRARSYLIDRLAPLGADPTALIRRLDAGPDISIRRALLLAIGEFNESALPSDAHGLLLPKLQEMYRTDADPGVHAAAEWLLRKWNQDAWLKQQLTDWASDKDGRAKRLAEIQRALPAADAPAAPPGSPRWFVNSQGQTLVVIPGPAKFLMGSPKHEAGHQDDETQHGATTGRSFAITATLVTREQFSAYFRDRGFANAYNLSIAQYNEYADQPAVAVNWFMAADYCNWLSAKEGLQPCYEISGLKHDDNFQHAKVTMRPNHLSLGGYRLPTEAEMEYAIRAGSDTGRYFGETDELLPSYGWYLLDSKDDTGDNNTHPVGRLKPNDFGLFDAHGNAFTWCQEEYDSRYAPDAVLAVDPGRSRVLRGGSFDTQPSNVRSAYRDDDVPTLRSNVLGLRAARTLPLVSLTALPPAAR